MTNRFLLPLCLLVVCSVAPAKGQPDTALQLHSTTTMEVQNFRSVQPQFDQDKVILPLDESREGKFKVTKLNQTGISSITRFSNRPVRDGQLTIQPGETYVIEDTGTYNAPAETLAFNRKMYFSSQMVKNVSRPATHGAPALNKWQLFMIPTDSPLSWQTEQKAYGTDIILGLESIDGDDADFDGNIKLHFKKFGPGIHIDPEEVRLTSSGMNHTRTVNLSCTAFDVNPEIEVLSDVGRKRVVFPLKPRQLEISVSDTTILGFGLESADIIVRSRGVNGSLLRNEAIDILLNKQGPGKLEATALTKNSGTLEASTKITSAGTGRATIIAESPLFVSDSASVRYVWPVALLLISLIGGIVGSGVRLYRKKIKGAKIAAHLAIGMLGGFLLVLAAAIGITQMDFTTSIATTHTGAIVLSLIGGYAGDGVFEWLGRKLGVISKTA